MSTHTRIRLLGRSDRESGPHAFAAALAGDWAEEPAELLGLGTLATTLATVAELPDLAAVLSIGHPRQPDPLVEEALLAAPRGVGLDAAATIETQWVWASPKETTSVVYLDEVAHRDVGHHLDGYGVPIRLVSVGMDVEERIALAGTDGSLVIEAPRCPADWHLIHRDADLNREAWFGLCSTRDARRSFDETTIVWLAFAPAVDRRGSLAEILKLFVTRELDLSHLRSYAVDSRNHSFFSAFDCPSSLVLSGLVDDLHRQGIQHRVLAVLDDVGPSEKSVWPRLQWDAP